MDDHDRKILTALQGDATMPLEKLGDNVGLSRNACWRRIKALEASGVIKAKVTLLDPASVGLKLGVFIQIRAERHDAEWEAAFRKAIDENPEILSAYRVSGEQDYILRAQVTDVAGYDRLYRRLVAQIDPAEVSATFVMEELKASTALPV